MGEMMSALWFFISPIPDISPKGKPKPRASASMLCSSVMSLLMLYFGYQYWSDMFPFVPTPFYPTMLLIFCLSSCSGSKLVGQARKFAKV